MFDRWSTAALLAALATTPCAAARADPVTLKETGSTLVLPLFRTWADTYGRGHGGVTITTDGTGSAKGIEAAVDGSAQIGASDAFMSAAQHASHPDVLNIALAIAAQTVNYNLPGATGALKLDGPTLAGIYAGAIRSWDDRAIAAMNPGVALPHHAIVPVRRADGSGDTFVFTQYLSFTTSAPEAVGFFTASPSWSTGPGFGTAIDWPRVEGERTATGNQGMVDLLRDTPYAVGYVGISFADAVQRAHLGTALMKSYSGEYLPATPDTITAAAASLTPRTPDDERVTLVNAPGANCYPLINYEYAMVSARQGDEATAAALRRFLLWATAPDEANASMLADARFIPLPASIWVKSHDQIERIKGPGR